MSAVQVNIGTTNHLDPTFAWYEVFASETNLALGAVEASAEWSTIDLSTRIIHANVSAGETWYFWVRPVYDQGARSGTLVALGSILISGAVSASFLSLTDTPNSYTGHGEKAVAVKADETGLEFIEFPLSSDSGSAFSGAMVRKSVDQTGANYSGAGAYVAWDQEAYDTDAYHDNSSSNTRLTVPANGKYQVGATIRMANVTSGSTYELRIDKSGSVTYDGSSQITARADVTLPAISICSGPVVATAGQYFELNLFCSDTSIDVTATRSNFWIQRIE